LGAASRSDLLLWIWSRGNHPRSVMERCNGLCVTVGWHADLFHGLRRDGKWRESAMWAATHVFTADGGHDKEFAAMGVNHKWLLPGVRDRWVQHRGRKYLERFMCDVAFVGNNGSSYHREWPYRAELLGRLQQMCADNGWVFRNPGGLHRQVERNGRMNDFYACAKVTVGDSLCLEHNAARYWSDRVYEACGRGGVLVMPQIDALAAQTKNVLPMYPWGDWNALEAIVGGLVADEGQRDGLRQWGRLWTSTNHTYTVRVGTLLNEVGL
jgi:hypothetical protein